MQTVLLALLTKGNKLVQPPDHTFEGRHSIKVLRSSPQGADATERGNPIPDLLIENARSDLQADLHGPESRREALT